MPLGRFKARTDRATKAVGYGKGTMVFHMLRQEVGEDAFFKGLRLLVGQYRFRRAGWSDLQAVFEQSSGKELSAFFRQWLERTDIPVVALKDGRVSSYQGSRSRVTLTLVQRTRDPYRLTVPLVVKTTQGEKRHWFLITEAEESVSLEVDGKASAVVLDPDYDIMRSLGAEENPPVLSRLLGAGRRIVLSPPSMKEPIYRPILDAWQERGFQVLPATEITHDDLKDTSFLVPGEPEGSFRHFLNNLSPIEKGVLLTVWENPFNRQEVMAVLQVGEDSDISKVARKLPHYGGYSTLKFQGGRLVEKKTPKSERGLSLALQGEILGIATRDLSPMHQIVNQVTTHKVIFVGERHTLYGDHLAQLEIIKGLARQGRKVAVGMEMFQRPYQPVIDQYMSGEIDERTFLARTEYFDRWRFDYNLYRSIVEYCKEQGLPLVALNVPTEIIRKVARQGLEALAETEKQQIPQDLDLSDGSYRDRLKLAFEQHPENDVRDFETFHQSQVLWDETMAETVHEFLNLHPEYQMVVLAGSGHLAYGDGIPARVRRRGGYDQAIILNVAGQDPSAEMADFLLFPTETSPPFTAKLGVYLEQKDGHLSVAQVAPRGPAGSAGLRAGDLLLDFDGQLVRTLPDLRLALFFKKEEDTAQLKVKRTRVLFPDQILTLKVGPFRPTLAAVHEPNHLPDAEEGEDENP
jgi:uncharacterized iron-regulated protein